MSARGRPVIDTAGIEIEFADLPKAACNHIRESVGWSLVEDGSVRNYRKQYFGLPVGGRRPVMFGGEFVSPLLDLTGSEWKNSVSKIVEALYRAGEGVNVSTSIHVHINAQGIPFYALHNLVRIAAYIEEAMFRWSCAEAGVHRGALHLDYAYCRPITKKGPPVVYCPTSDTQRQIFDLDGLLNAESVNDFRIATGRYDRWDGGKYHEARYSWFNLISLWTHGSVEFRPFNFTGNHRNIITWAKLCSQIVRRSFGKVRKDLPMNPLGSGTTDLSEVLAFLELQDDVTAYQLEKLWNMADYQRGVIGYQTGHIGHSCSWRGVRSELKPHIIRDETIYPFYRFRADSDSIRHGGITLKTRR